MASPKEKGFRAYGFGGVYHQEFTGMPIAPFGGYLFRESPSGKVFGRMIDHHGEASVIGNMRTSGGQDSTLFLLKMYDASDNPNQDFREIPITYRLATQPDSNLWTGHYKIQRTNGGRVECSLTNASMPMSDRDITKLSDELWITVTRMRNRLAQREATILSFHPEKRMAIQRVRGFRGDPPRLNL